MINMAGGSPDRNFETIRHQLEGQYHRNHGAALERMSKVW